MHSNVGSDKEKLIKEKWDVFKIVPIKKKIGSLNEYKWIELSVKILKVLVCLITFTLVLGSAVVSKGTLLFMTSQIAPNRILTYCNKNLGIHKEFVVTLPRIERLAWIWVIIFSYFIVELATFIRSLRMCMFKTWSVPTKTEVIFLFVMESLPTIGSALLVFWVLPELDVLKGVMLTNALCFVPAVAGFFARNSEYRQHDEESSSRSQKNCSTLNEYISKILDVFSILAQATAFVIWPIMEDKPRLWAIPVSIIFISFGWLENYIPKQFLDYLIQRPGKSDGDNTIQKPNGFGRKFDNSRYFAYIFLSIWKCLLFFITALVIIWINEDNIDFIFQDFTKAFEEHDISVTEIKPIISSNTSYDISEVIHAGKSESIPAEHLVPLGVFIINIGATYICYAFGKFACKIMNQTFGYAFPINLVVPVTITLLITVCGMHSADPCSFYNTVPPYLFFNGPPVYFIRDFIGTQQSWIWLLWLLSQTWITFHLWSPRCEKLASTEKLYVKPMYDAFFIDQSIAMNRRRDDYSSPSQLTMDHSQTTTIYACATMWHETQSEMLAFLKSVIRLDTDQFIRKYAQNELKATVDDYYELETHIFFDDAFTVDGGLNKYVEWLIETVPEAIRDVHTTIRIKAYTPEVYKTPYGGRLEWILPGETKMIVHLKDKTLIQIKKRWSQVMYMYYLLGYRIMAKNISPDEKDIQSNNTFLLALDGDIDFQPQALHHLVTLMKRNLKVGAACGRIHPLGSGPMVWFQIFEYSVGHWLQKATEHMIGSVLCSPGCFSLFRGKALMDDNIMAKYTSKAQQASHYLQYDQGEDRWLCTLLLQRGYKVEFCAASDAYTYCPEKFNEFYNQRRRWMPSTFANVLDLLIDYEYTLKMNDNISLLYILYQGFLMVGTVLGPGTIFLMLVGSFVAAFQLSQWESFIWNAIPIILFMVVCFWCNPDIQLFFAGLLSAIYGLVMMAVLVGVMLQIAEDGPLAPSSLFFFVTVAQMCITGLLHPKEAGNLLYGVIYYVTIPSMYLLLVIYATFNLHVTKWGTRESSTDKPEEGNEVSTDKNTRQNILPKASGTKKTQNKGSLEYPFSGLFTCMLCTHSMQSEENKKLLKILDSMDKVSNRLDEIEKLIQDKPTQASDIRSSTEIVEINVSPEPQPPLTGEVNKKVTSKDGKWIDHKMLAGNVATDLEDPKEIIFWTKIIGERGKLKPDDKEDVEVKKQLIDLRDKAVMAFIMLNSIFVLVVFLLTLKKDIMHFKWPLNVKVNFTYNEAAREIKIYKEHLQLEPIGFVFLLFFGLLLIIQFIAMLFHRFATFAQILASTHINWRYILNRKALTPEQHLEIDPVKCVELLTKSLKTEVQTVERRKTVRDRALECEINTEVEFDGLRDAIEQNKNNDTFMKDALNNRRHTVKAQAQFVGGYVNEGFAYA